jgi:hypothetical protein
LSFYCWGCVLVNLMVRTFFVEKDSQAFQLLQTSIILLGRKSQVSITDRLSLKSKKMRGVGFGIQYKMTPISSSIN